MRSRDKEESRKNYLEEHGSLKCTPSLLKPPPKNDKLVIMCIMLRLMFTDTFFLG